MTKVSEEVEKIRTRVQYKEDVVKYTSSSDFPGTIPGLDDAWSYKKFKKQCRIDIVKLEGNDFEFDLIGVDASIANALRRIMLVEVPTIAVETVYYENNTSIMQDEVLAHRIGLIPLNVNPFGDFHFAYKSADEDPTDDNTIVFKIDVKHDGGSHKKRSKKDKEKPQHDQKTMLVMSKDLQWEPQGAQEGRFGDSGIRPVHDDILLMKLRPGQEIRATLHCHLGIGKDHAKFSPVGTASYRLLPEIIIKEQVAGEKAKRLQQCFSKGVIELVKEKGEEVAKVANPRLETMSREVFRHPDLAPLVELNRVRNHFIFSVESIGAIPPEVIFAKSIEVLRDKCATVLRSLDELAVE